MPATTPQAEQLRADLATLLSLTNGDLADVWRSVNSATSARDVLLATLPQIVNVYAPAAATLAADWYDTVRDEAQIPGAFRAVPAPIKGDLGAEQLTRWAVGPLFSAEPDWVTAQSYLQGGLQRRIVNMARDTITVSSVVDPKARGWQRVGTGECDFCERLIARGAVYTQETAPFAAHDHCRCQAVPVFKGRPVPVRAYAPSSRAAGARASTAQARSIGFENLTRAQIEHQITVTEALPESGWRAGQLSRLRARLAEMTNT